MSVTAHPVVVERTSSAVAVAAAGVAVIGATFGMGRYGYGLLLPDIRASFQLSSGALGVIAAGSYITYLATTVIAGLVAPRTGPRVLVLLAGALAAAGMLLIAVASTRVILAAGVAVAGSGAGFALPPFSEVVAARVVAKRRARAWAMISSGTGAGVALAAPIAILAGSSWRTTWVVFAILTLLGTLIAARAVPSATRGQRAPATVRLSWRWFACPRSGPLLIGALVVGLTASVWWTFAVDYAASQGELSRSAARGLSLLVGIASLIGGGAGDLVRRLGGRAAFTTSCLVFGGALAAFALAPGAWPVAALAGLAFGSAYCALVAIQGLWSARVFADRPSAGVAAVMAMSGIGLLTGPLVAGPLADHFGLRTVFLAAAAVAAAVALLAPREPLD